mmetsp:Transcript_6744/g.11481  ORF Transcript_6744/g.11481 Transcript_6744/m.11481 type:complete len:226 (+) Transcript_6744:1841-2518(+)
MVAATSSASLALNRERGSPGGAGVGGVATMLAVPSLLMLTTMRTMSVSTRDFDNFLVTNPAPRAAPPLLLAEPGSRLSCCCSFCRGACPPRSDTTWLTTFPVRLLGLTPGAGLPVAGPGARKISRAGLPGVSRTAGGVAGGEALPVELLPVLARPRWVGPPRDPRRNMPRAPVFAPSRQPFSSAMSRAEYARPVYLPNSGSTRSTCPEGSSSLVPAHQPCTDVIP